MKIEVDCCNRGPVSPAGVQVVEPELARMLFSIHHEFPNVGKSIRLNMEATVLCDGCQQKIYRKFKELGGKRLMTKAQFAWAQELGNDTAALYAEIEERLKLDQVPTLLEEVSLHG